MPRPNRPSPFHPIRCFSRRRAWSRSFATEPTHGVDRPAAGARIAFNTFAALVTAAGVARVAAIAAVAAIARVAAIAAVAAITMSPLSILSAPVDRAMAQDAGPSADLLVDLGDGRVLFERIPIEEGATGSDLLAASGLNIDFGSGQLVCRVNDVGCPAQDCFCACEDLDDCVYWSYFHGDPEVDGGWEFASVGAADRSLEDGDIDAWVWGAKRQPITATLALRDALAEGIDANADPEAAAAVEDAATWISAHRMEDGGFEGFGLGSTIDAVLALAAVGEDPDPPADTGKKPSDSIAAGAAEYAAGGSSAAGKLLTGAAVLGLDPRDLGGTDVVSTLMESLDPSSGAFGAGGTWDQAWSIIGLAAIDEEIPESAVDALIDAAVEGGGWGFEANADTADTDSTGLALQALGAAGMVAEDGAIRRGLSALRALQNPDGAFAGHDGESNATSTAYAIGGLVAAGQAVDGLGWSVAGVGDEPDVPRSPLDALRSFQGADGAFAGFSGSADPSATYAALLGLSSRSLPIRTAADSVAPQEAGEGAGVESSVGDDGSSSEEGGGTESGTESTSGRVETAIEGGESGVADDAEAESGDGGSDGATTEGSTIASRLGAWPLIALFGLLGAGLWWMRRRT